MGLPATGPRSAASGGHGTNRAESTLVSQQQREKPQFLWHNISKWNPCDRLCSEALDPPKNFFPFF